MSPAALLLALASLDPAAATTPATAQATQSQTPVVPAIEDQEAYDLGEIQAVSTKRRGAALGDYEPELVLDEEQLKAYGASSIQERRRPKRRVRKGSGRRSTTGAQRYLKE